MLRLERCPVGPPDFRVLEGILDLLRECVVREKETGIKSLLPISGVPLSSSSCNITRDNVLGIRYRSTGVVSLLNAAEMVHFRLEFRVGDRMYRFLHRESLVLLQCDCRLHLVLDLELEGGAPLEMHIHQRSCPMG